MTFGCYCRKSSRWMPRTNGSRWKRPAANHPLGLARRGDRQTVFWLTPMEMYLHDSANSLQFVLRGGLANQVRDLEQAWTTARSILAGKALVVDVSGITDADESGVDLLSRIRESGARLTAALPPKSEEFLRSLGLRAAAPSGRTLRPQGSPVDPVCRA